LKIVIHFGPPKTGTSSIQNWCLNHRGFLEDSGVYYPPHDIDRNGVSSGNLFALYQAINNPVFSSDKLMQCINNAQARGCHTLLFSSEFFFKDLSKLASDIPNAIFIGYIRFGLNSVQSSYVQSVKRHGNTVKFDPSKRIDKSIDQLRKFVVDVGVDRYQLRPFDKLFFSRNNLIIDFLDMLNIDYIKIPGLDKKINSSYSLVSLEVMRWFNKSSSKVISNQLDQALQSFSDSLEYSLFDDESYTLQKAFYIQQLKRFFSIYKDDWTLKYLNTCQSSKNENRLEQSITIDQFKSKMSQLIELRLISTSMILKYLVQYEGDCSHPYFIELFNLLPFIHQLKYKAIKFLLR